MSSYPTFCAVIRSGNSYRAANRVNDMRGHIVDEAWLFGTRHSPDDDELYHAIQAVCAHTGGVIHWMPLPRISNEGNAAPFKYRLLGYDKGSSSKDITITKVVQAIQSNQIRFPDENSPRR